MGIRDLGIGDSAEEGVVFMALHSLQFTPCRLNSGRNALARPVQSTLARHVGVQTYKFVSLTSRVYTCQVVTLEFSILQVQ